MSAGDQPAMLPCDGHYQSAIETADEPTDHVGAKPDCLQENDYPAIMPSQQGDPHHQGHQPGSAKQEPEIKEESLVKMSSSTNPELSRTKADKEKFTSIYCQAQPSPSSSFSWLAG